jgi:hypothetical protein
MTSLRLQPAYHQFYVFDEVECPLYPENIDETDIGRGVKAVPFLIAVYTQSEDEVDVAFDLHATGAAIQEDEWEHIVEAPLDVPSGSILVATPESHLTECPRVSLVPGSYRVFICCRRRAGSGREEYVLTFVPAHSAVLRVIKSGRPSAA